MGKQVTVCSALHTYRTPDGENRQALHGAVIELDDAELDRALRLGAVVEGDEVLPRPGPVIAPNPPVSPDEAGKLLDEQPPAKRPAAKRSPAES